MTTEQRIETIRQAIRKIDTVIDEMTAESRGDYLKCAKADHLHLAKQDLRRFINVMREA